MLNTLSNKQIVQFKSMQTELFSVKTESCSCCYSAFLLEILMCEISVINVQGGHSMTVGVINTFLNYLGILF